MKVVVVEIDEAKTNFSKLLKPVKAGDEVIVKNFGKPVARIVPFRAPRASASQVRSRAGSRSSRASTICLRASTSRAPNLVRFLTRFESVDLPPNLIRSRPNQIRECRSRRRLSAAEGARHAGPRLRVPSRRRR
jgi:prevent-host-death family protein